MFLAHYFLYLIVANVSLECDSVVVDESVQSLEVCTTFISGELGINITVNLSTICGSACSKLLLLLLLLLLF